MRPGLVVSLEGISNAGKTTGISHLTTVLERVGLHPVIKEDLLAYKGDSVGFQIKRILDQAAPTYRLGFPCTETLLIIAKRAFESQTRLEPAVSEGAIVLCDRDVDTVCAYQLPVLSTQRQSVPSDVWVKWMRETNRLSAVEPSLTVYLDVTVDNAIERESQQSPRPLTKNDRRKLREHNEPLLQAYGEVLALPLPGRTLISIDTNNTSEQAVAAELEETLLGFLRQRDFQV